MKRDKMRFLMVIIIDLRFSCFGFKTNEKKVKPVFINFEIQRFFIQCCFGNAVKSKDVDRLQTFQTCQRATPMVIGADNVKN